MFYSCFQFFSKFGILSNSVLELIISPQTTHDFPGLASAARITEVVIDLSLKSDDDVDEDEIMMSMP